MNRKYFIWIGIVALLFVGCFIADSLLFDGIRSRTINKSGFQANYYTIDIAQQKASIVLVGGEQWGD